MTKNIGHTFQTSYAQDFTSYWVYSLLHLFSARSPEPFLFFHLCSLHAFQN